MILGTCVSCDPKSNPIDFGDKDQGQTWKVSFNLFHVQWVSHTLGHSDLDPDPHSSWLSCLPSAMRMHKTVSVVFIRSRRCDVRTHARTD